ncbi:uncharacterized protein SCHCODRAFT_01159347 [Schizophyllum commune H4-8]|uniref:Expressed protein n=1 Tax=Schizophyllum commune (strain H4-8 / FGSC 9210) TaxID=578458 RepID=D8QDW5_SCHCM|nr:uncharacterized protein SCHCODRAFT_01159347 [Schizophyllum commune H4-8]KAI5888552.1 hypothetical protein SCHCODRAFT_01159347 [Schizophyllum commune H4-8]
MKRKKRTSNSFLGTSPALRRLPLERLLRGPAAPLTIAYAMFFLRSELHILGQHLLSPRNPSLRHFALAYSTVYSFLTVLYFLSTDFLIFLSPTLLTKSIRPVS